MSQSGNAYRNLSPERKLQLFSFEAERFLTSIIGYSKLLLAESEQDTTLSADFVRSLDAIQRTGSKFAQIIREVNYLDGGLNATSSPHEILLLLLNQSGSLIPVITGYCAMLDMEARKPDFPTSLSPRFLDNFDMLLTAAIRLSKTREELSVSMK
ncbi:MAG TPA: hypothetical protein VHD90_21755 [Phototrophicaceae bacterium]|nr:hypothetical protein [Phototrophicaceae bacterium]